MLYLSYVSATTIMPVIYWCGYAFLVMDSTIGRLPAADLDLEGTYFLMPAFS